MNTVTLIGNLVDDLKLTETTSGQKVARGRIAVDRVKGDEADFINVATWNGAAEAAVANLSKGSKIAVHGRLRSSTWEAQDGTKRYGVEVVAPSFEFLSPKKDGAPAPTAASGEFPTDEDAPF